MVFSAHSSAYSALSSSRWFRLYGSLARLSLPQQSDSEFNSVSEGSLRQRFSLCKSHQQSSISWAPQCVLLSISLAIFGTADFQRRHVLISLVMRNGSRRAFSYPHEVYSFHYIQLSLHNIASSKPRSRPIWMDPCGKRNSNMHMKHKPNLQPCTKAWIMRENVAKPPTDISHNFL